MRFLLWTRIIPWDFFFCEQNHMFKYSLWIIIVFHLCFVKNHSASFESFLFLSKKNLSSFSGIQEWAEAAISSGADDSVSMFFEAHGSSTSGELVQHQWGVGPTCRGFHGSRLQGASSDEEVEESFLVEIWCVFFLKRFRIGRSCWTTLVMSLFFFPELNNLLTHWSVVDWN